VDVTGPVLSLESDMPVLAEPVVPLVMPDAPLPEVVVSDAPLDEEVEPGEAVPLL
jgi:hypothetical protein